MNQPICRFVVATKDIKNQSGILVEKGDVGIIKLPQKEHVFSFFIRAWREVILGENDFRFFDVRRTGDSFSKKICNICHKLLETTEFAKNQNARNGNYIHYY